MAGDHAAAASDLHRKRGCHGGDLPGQPAGQARDVPGALAHTAAVIYGLLVVTAASGGTELALIAAQDELVHPSHTFEPVRLR